MITTKTRFKHGTENPTRYTDVRSADVLLLVAQESNIRNSYVTDLKNSSFYTVPV